MPCCRSVWSRPGGAAWEYLPALPLWLTAIRNITRSVIRRQVSCVKCQCVIKCQCLCQCRIVKCRRYPPTVLVPRARAVRRFGGRRVWHVGEPCCAFCRSVRRRWGRALLRTYRGDCGASYLSLVRERCHALSQSWYLGPLLAQLEPQWSLKVFACGPLQLWWAALGAAALQLPPLPIACEPGGPV